MIRKTIGLHLGMAALIFVFGKTASAGGSEVELDEAEVFIEWNSTDTDFGIQFFWDSSGFTEMEVRNEEGKKVRTSRPRKI